MNVGGSVESSASLYVGDLREDVTEALLFEIFNAVGPVASIRVCRDVMSRKSLGYAYVNFHDPKDAERALDTMNFTVIKGKPCRIMWSCRDPSQRKSEVGNIFVKNLDKSIDNKTLFDTFSLFGDISSCKVATSENGDSLGYGFVQYVNEKSAKEAIEKVNGMVIAEKSVEVLPFRRKAERDKNKTDDFTNVYIRNFPPNIRTHLEEFGEIQNFDMPQSKENKPVGFCFCNFAEHSGARKAIEGLHDKEVEYEDEDGKKNTFKVYCVRHKTKKERESERKQFIKEREAAADRTLFVKNLAETVTDKGLAEEFGKYGKIQSVKVVKDNQTGKSRGFAFICYEKVEEAVKAVGEMNGKRLNDKELFVAVHQPKEERQRPNQPYGGQFGRGFGPGRGGFGGRGGFMQPSRGGGYMAPGGYMQPGPYGPNSMFRGGPQRQPMMMPPRGPGPFQAPADFPRQPGYPGRPMPMQMNQRPMGMGGRPQMMPRPQQPMPQRQVPTNSGPQRQVAATSGPLTAQQLAQVDSKQQKQLIGERIFPQVQAIEPKLAGKITGMLLEMDNTELLHLLENKATLMEKVNEALHILQQSARQAGVQ